MPQYASVFGAVEGNSTFYALPPPETAKRWAKEAPAGFRFCFKFPRRISHELGLRRAEAETRVFLRWLEPLRERMGPVFLQLGPRFGPESTADLRAFLRGLPADLAVAVEVRNTGFFDNGVGERMLDDVLGEAGVDRVHFDTQALFAACEEDAALAEARRRKPRLPLRQTVTGRRPFVRFVGEPRIERNGPWLEPWVKAVARWVREGLEPHVFIHHADDLYAPDLARFFHARLVELDPALGPVPSWPGEDEASQGPEQLALF